MGFSKAAVIYISTVSVLSHGSVGAQSRSREEQKKDCEELNQLLEDNKGLVGVGL